MEQMPMCALVDAVQSHSMIVVPILLLLLAALVVYLVYMTRAVIEMLRYQASSVLLVFSFLALIPFPLIILWGILILIIWHYHKPDLQAQRGSRQAESTT